MTRSIVLAAAVAIAFAAVPASAQDDPQPLIPASLPLLGTETPRGKHLSVALPDTPAAPRTLDGIAGDWSGNAANFSGAAIRSHGELVYTDHLFDAHGADDGKDAEALDTFDGSQAVLPEAYRLEILIRQNPAGEFGAPTPEQLEYKMNYGDLGMQDVADLSEVRVGVDGDELWLLGRTTTMRSAADTGLLVLLDTTPGTRERPVGFGSGLKTTKADIALLLAGNRGWSQDLATGEVTPLPSGSVATDPSGYNNAVEAKVSRSTLGIGDSVNVAVAAGKQNPAGDGLANVANVAFRSAEPVREWFDKRQALALHAGTIDEFFTPADLAGLAAGDNRSYVPGPGYHERVFRSTEDISREGGTNGILQHYGVYVPKAAAATEAKRRKARKQRSSQARRRALAATQTTPLQLWLHWRGGTAHSAGSTVPRVFKDMGDAHDTIVISPRGRGSSSWYVGKGHKDVMQVWEDVHARFGSIDPTRRYVSGHSMGGWGSFLMTITHPDWFAGALPASPPVTQGAWTGLDFDGCDDYVFDDYSPCYIQANGGDSRKQHTRRLLENVRHVPWAIYHGTADELVPVSGVTRQAERLIQLGYRHRLYLFHTQEHYGPPVWDQWKDGADYMHTFANPVNPDRVSFRRDLDFEDVVSTANKKPGQDDTQSHLDFDFDEAYWMSDLEVDTAGGNRAAGFEGHSLGIAEKGHQAVPEAGGPTAVGNAGPFTMTGLAWLTVEQLHAAPAPSNGFELTLTGAKSVTLDGDRMGLDPAKTIAADITTDRPVTVTVTFDDAADQVFTAS